MKYVINILLNFGVGADPTPKLLFTTFKWGVFCTKSVDKQTQPHLTELEKGDGEKYVEKAKTISSEFCMLPFCTCSQHTAQVNKVSPHPWVTSFIFQAKIVI